MSSINTPSVASKQNLGTSIFNWNDLYDLQRNTEGLYLYLICYQLHGKGGHFLVPIALEECYHFYSGCDYGSYCQASYLILQGLVVKQTLPDPLFLL